MIFGKSSLLNDPPGEFRKDVRGSLIRLACSVGASAFGPFRTLLRKARRRFRTTSSGVDSVSRTRRETGPRPVRAGPGERVPVQWARINNSL